MKKIMVIDDEPFILMMLEDKLTAAGYQVITRRDGTDAIEVVKKEQPDLIILDWMMPRISGIDVCKRLKEDIDTAYIPVFMLTAKGQAADERIGLQCGIARYITKPFSPKGLIAEIEEFFGRQVNR